MANWRATSKFLGVFFCFASCLAAYGVSEAEVKAAYILNFAKFVEWPSQQKPNNTILQLCITRPDALDGKLQQLNGRQAGGMVIHVHPADLSQEWNTCQIVFLSAEDMDRSPTLLSTLSKHPVLTISDTPDFVMHGGVIGFLLQDNRVKFSVNLGVAKATGLHLSARLLQVADTIYAEPR